MCSRLLLFLHTVDANTWGRLTFLVPSLKYGVSLALLPQLGGFHWKHSLCVCPLDGQEGSFLARLVPNSQKTVLMAPNVWYRSASIYKRQFVDLKFSPWVARAMSALSQVAGLGVGGVPRCPPGTLP